MRLRSGRRVALLLAVLSLAGLGADASPSAQNTLPNPVLVLSTIEPYKAGGKTFLRYRYLVENSSAYPDTLFAASPNLPPCGTNTRASRTWVDFYDVRGKRLYGFCALGKASDLNQIWFATEEGVVPPSWVYIELTDRATNTKYKSNLAETTQ